MRKSRKVLTITAIGTLLSILGIMAYQWTSHEPDRWFDSTWSAFQKNQLKTVREQIQRRVNDPNVRTECDFFEGALLLRQGRFYAALENFRRTPPRGRVRHAVLLLVGECQYWLKNYPDAEQLFATLAADRPTDAEPHRWLGAVYFDIGLTGSAVFELEKAIELNPLDHRPHRLLASIFIDVGRHEKAIQHYQAAIQLGPPDVPQNDIFEELANALLKTNRFSDAIATAKSIKPPTAEAMLIIAQACRQIGDFENSLDYLEHAFEIDKSNARATLLKGKWLLETGNSADSLPLLAASTLRSPHDVEARYQYARALLLEGQRDSHDEQLRLLKDSEALHKRYSQLHDRTWANPDDVEAREELAETTKLLGKPEVSQFWARAAQACRERRSRFGPETPENTVKKK